MSTVLVLTGGPPHAHDFPATAAALADTFAALGHDAQVVDDPDVAADKLADVDVLAVNALRWRMIPDTYDEWRADWAYSPPPSTRRALTDFVDHGGRLLASHTAPICFDDWPEWGDLVGGAWCWGVSSHPPWGPVTVEVVAEHPVVAGLPASFELFDEVYGDLELRPGLEVLAVARRFPEDQAQPVVWTHGCGSGRVVYDAFGHDVTSLRQPEHRQLLEQALTWLLEDAVMRPIENLSMLVTGGGSGIGAGIARHFCKHGALVTISGRRSAKIDEVAGSIGASCRAVVGDVTVADDRAAMVGAALEHGDGRLDVLVNNAGNMYRGPLAELEEQRLLEVFHSNVVGGMMLTQAALDHLVAARGAVIFVGSTHSQRAFPGVAPYAATKGAVETLTGVLAAELGPLGVRVSCVRPGAVFTELNQRAGVVVDDTTGLQRLERLAPAHALGRIGTVDEVAEAVEYLARAEWTTGDVLTVDGGLGLGVTNE